MTLSRRTLLQAAAGAVALPALARGALAQAGEGRLGYWLCGALTHCLRVRPLMLALEECKLLNLNE